MTATNDVIKHVSALEAARRHQERVDRARGVYGEGASEA